MPNLIIESRFVSGEKFLKIPLCFFISFLFFSTQPPICMKLLYNKV